ncbi:MAG: hypothetical protein Q9166_002528 [cf. Caloplaca sp. 2 TL-2023]
MSTSVSASSTAAAKPPQRLQFSQANLDYKTASDKEWIRLDPLQNNAEFNIVDVDIRYGITLKQKFPDGAGTCSLEFKPEEYSSGTITADPMPGKSHPNMLWVHFKPASIPSCELTRTKVGDDDTHSLQDFPLHRISPGFCEVRLRLPHNKLKTSKNKPVQWYVDLLTDLTTGDISQLAGANEEQYIKNLMNGQLAESKASFEALKTMKKCFIKTRWEKQKMWLWIEPEGLAEFTDNDLQQKPNALQYVIKESQLFPDDKTILKSHPIWGISGSHGWQVTIEPTKKGFMDPAPPIVGTIDNCFGTDYNQYAAKQEKNVELEPIFLDVGGNRARASLKDFEKMCDEEAKELSGFLSKDSDTSARSKLPVRELFLPALKFSNTDNDLADGNSTVPPECSNNMNTSQLEAIAMPGSKHISIIHGPPATGKSETIAWTACKCSRDRPGEKILVCAPTNVAVNEICARMVKVWGKRIDKTLKLQFVRLYSEGQIRQQMRNEQKSDYENPVHLDWLRYSLANKNPGKYQGYLRGREQLINVHAINSKDLWDGYIHQARELTDRVLKDALVVFVTCDSLRCRALRRTETIIDEETGASKERVVAWEATTCIMDEAGCANPLQVLIPLTTFNKTLKHFILAGDHKQLPPHIESQEAKDLWTKSFLKDCIDKKVPYVLLNRQYRAHEKLYAAANQVIYEGKVDSEFKTEHPRPYLRGLLSSLPLKFSAKAKKYCLTSYSNFINIPHSEHKSKPQGSSCNDVSWTLLLHVFTEAYNLQDEVTVIEGLVDAFKSSGRPLNSIAIISGYSWQLEKLKKMAVTRQWSGLSILDPDQVSILTADTCQGKEWDIVIISLVKTSGGAGFIGSPERANVVWTRAREARYMVGNWTKFWYQKPEAERSKYETMFKLLQAELYLQKKEDNPFVVNPA